MTRFCLDADSFIETWHVQYKFSIPEFEQIWEMLVQERRYLTIIKPIFDEIEPVTSGGSPDKIAEKYPLRTWLEDNGFLETVEPIPENVERASLELEKKYEIKENGKGAGQNDIRLIAYAQHIGGCVVTMEREQPQEPKKLSSYRIPLICRKEEVGCCKFVEMLEELSELRAK